MFIKFECMTTEIASELYKSLDCPKLQLGSAVVVDIESGNHIGTMQARFECYTTDPTVDDLLKLVHVSANMPKNTKII